MYLSLYYAIKNSCGFRNVKVIGIYDICPFKFVEPNLPPPMKSCLWPKIIVIQYNKVGSCYCAHPASVYGHCKDFIQKDITIDADQYYGIRNAFLQSSPVS